MAHTGAGWLVSVSELNQSVIDVPLFSEPNDPAFPSSTASIYVPSPTRSATYSPNCACGCPAERKRASSSDRSFFACAKSGCKFFRWADWTAYSSVLAKTTWRALPWRLFRGDGAASAAATDIAQGRLGDCWFLSALSVLSEDKMRFARLFNQRTEIAASAAAAADAPVDVTLFVDGRLLRVPVDRKFPTFSDSGRPIFSATVGNGERGLWVSAAEKAYAKVNGNYAKISGGEISEGLFDLVGLPVETVAISECPRDLLWTRLLSFQSCGFLMGCATSFARPENGIAPFHAYSVLDVVEVQATEKIGRQLTLGELWKKPDTKPIKDERNIVRLLKLRNPWGRFEWRGSWSSRCPNWTSEIAKRLGKTDRDDGVFFMEISDFINNFHVLDVCKTHTDWHILTFQFSQPTQSLRIRAPQNTWLYVTAIKPSRRRHPDSPLFDLGVRVRSAGKFFAQTRLQSLERLVTLELVLDEGEYEIEFPCFLQRRNFAVQIYSAHPVLAKSENHISAPNLSAEGESIELSQITENLTLDIRKIHGVFVFFVTEVYLLDVSMQLRVDLHFPSEAAQLFITSGSKSYESGTVAESEAVRVTRVATAVPKHERLDALIPYVVDVVPVSASSHKRRRI